MQELIGLSVSLQLVLVAGYLAYKVSMMGRGNGDRTEDFLLKVLAFGLIAKLLADLAAWMIVPILDPAAIVFLRGVQAKGLVVIGLAILIAMAWRKKLSSWVAAVMKQADIYRDDHEVSTWHSIANAPAYWNHVQVYLADGRCLESFANEIPKNRPTEPYLINEDGIGIYVTAEFKNGEPVGGDALLQNDRTNTITYVSRDQIERIDIGWRKK